MDQNPVVYEVALFELRTQGEAEQLAARLGPSWTVFLELWRAKWRVGVELRSSNGDLEMLLAAVLSWAAERSLARVRIELEGCIYPGPSVEERNGVQRFPASGPRV